MKDDHLDPELMAAILEGEIPTVELVGRAWRHLLALCPQCREAFRTFQQRRPAADYRKAFAKLRQTLDQQEAPAKEERQRVEEELAALLALPAGSRVRKVERARKRFRSPQLAEALLAQSRKHLPGQPREALDLARTAKAVLFSSHRPERVPDLWPRVLAHLGNAMRASQGDLHEAEEHFQEARRFLTLFGGSDPLVAAEVDDLEASLRRDQRRFGLAEELLHRAAVLYQRLGEAETSARCLINLGIVHNQQGEAERAVETARKALALLPADADPRLTWCAVHSVAVYLCDADRPAEARKVLESNRSLYEPFPDAWSRLRLRWLEGKIASGLGEEEAAEEALLATREGFLREDLPYDAAAVSLELALLYARRGRAADLADLAEEVVRIFTAQEIHRDALAALLLFREAARAQQVTAQAVRRLMARLEELRRGPDPARDLPA